MTATATLGAFGRQVYAVLAKDLLIEWRTKDSLTAMLVFALLVLVTFNFALDLRPELLSSVGPGVLWVAIVFGSTLGLGRTFAVERDAVIADPVPHPGASNTFAERGWMPSAVARSRVE